MDRAVRRSILVVGALVWCVQWSTSCTAGPPRSEPIADQQHLSWPVGTWEIGASGGGTPQFTLTIDSVVVTDVFARLVRVLAGDVELDAARFVTVGGSVEPEEIRLVLRDSLTGTQLELSLSPAARGDEDRLRVNDARWAGRSLMTSSDPWVARRAR